MHDDETINTHRRPTAESGAWLWYWGWGGDAMTEDELFAMGLYRICETLHMAGNGSADPLFDEEREELLAYLRKRVDEWQPRESAYDSAMFALVRATLDEVPVVRIGRRPAKESA